MPVTPGAACSSYSTWVPTDVAAGPGGESLLWDQTAAPAFIQDLAPVSEIFDLKLCTVPTA